MSARISVVVPCLGDRALVESLVARVGACAWCHEIVVADATPGEERWQCEGAVVVACSEAGRGAQLNAGAEAASGDVLIFNHADTEIGPDHLRALAAAMGAGGAEGVVGGAFHKDLRRHHPRLAWAEPWVRVFTRRWGILYGDQSVFVRRDCFVRMGGYAPIPLMEDVDFSLRLRRGGRVVLLDPPLETSMRRFRRDGYLRAKARNLVMLALFRMRLASPERLYHWYYRGCPPTGAGAGSTIRETSAGVPTRSSR